MLVAALEVLQEEGVAGITHRKVAVRGDVPLGSVTYHFTSLTELCTQAFGQYVEQQTAEYEALFAAVASREDLADALVGLAGEGRPGAAARSSASNRTWPRCAIPPCALTQEWTRSSRAVLARFSGPETPARLDALLGGMITHALLSTEREPLEETRATIVQTLGPGRRIGYVNTDAGSPGARQTTRAVRSTYLVFGLLGLTGATWKSCLPQIRE